MIKKFHGQKYYTAFEDKKTAQKAKDLLKTDKRFKDLKTEIFHVSKVNDQFVLYSEALVGTFKGKKMQAWQLFKDVCYKLRRGV